MESSLLNMLRNTIVSGKYSFEISNVDWFILTGVSK